MQLLAARTLSLYLSFFRRQPPIARRCVRYQTDSHYHPIAHREQLIQLPQVVYPNFEFRGRRRPSLEIEGLW
jgi:hypothetical protein